MAAVLTLEQFWHSPARQLLAYPSGDETTLARRWAELQTYQIDAIFPHGPQTLMGLDILGLGYCGVVLNVRHQGRCRVLKIRREPAPQASLRPEAAMQLRANAVGVGPQHIAHSDNFLLMDHIDGPMLVDWLQSFQPAEAIHRVVRQLIHQAYRLDQAGLDHGDLRCITAHGLVQAKGPVLIDFSGASLNRRPANVTTLVQGLFISTHIAQLLRPWFSSVNKAELINYLRRYKQQPSLPQVNLLLSYLGLGAIR
ncbi:MAG: serine/threonine protein kinase [Cyanobacteria bacterium J06633_23]